MSTSFETALRDLTIAVPDQVTAVMSQLVAAGFEAFVVGGCVRDALLRKEPHDWDMTTNATPDQMKEAVSFRSIDTGLKHGTITFVVDGEPIEVTTFRADGTYSDGRHPDSIEFANTLEDDLSRRDFTVNAMAWSPETGVVDPFGGLADLAEKRLRCVGDACMRFSEDGLRVMRALRFAAVYGFMVEERTAQAAHEKKWMLDVVSKERISTELTKMMGAPDGAHLGAIVKEFADVMMQIMPELEPTYGLDQQNPHHDRDCWTHMVDVMAGVDVGVCADTSARDAVAVPETGIVLRLAALLHDIGKPACKVVGDDGVAHYRGHAEEGARIANQLLRRLKFPRKTIDQAVFLIEQHDNWPSPTLRSARRFLARCGDETTARMLLAIMKADRRAHAPASVGKRERELEIFGQIMETVLQEETAFRVTDLAISGNDLIAAGWEPGPELGCELNRLFDLVVSDGVPNDRAVLLEKLHSAPPS